MSKDRSNREVLGSGRGPWASASRPIATRHRPLPLPFTEDNLDELFGVWLIARIGNAPGAETRRDLLAGWLDRYGSLIESL